MVQELQWPDKTNLKKLLQDHTPQLLDIPDEKLQKPRVSTERAMEQTQYIQQNFEPLLAEVDKAFSPERAQQIKTAFQQLPIHLFVVFAAFIKSQEPWSEQEKKRFKELANKVRQDDVLYMKFSRTLYIGDAEANAHLDQIQTGNGYQDDAEDVIALSRFLLSSSKSIFPNPFFTKDDLHQSEQDAIQFMWLLRGRKEGRAAKSSPPDLWYRAYTLWTQTYNLLANAGRYLTEEHPDKATLFPSIHNRVKRSSVSQQKSEKNNPTESSNPTDSSDL